MKKLAIAAALLVATTSAMAEEVTTSGMDFSPFVGAERLVKADETIAYVGVDTSIGGLDVSGAVDLNLKADDATTGVNRFDVTNYNLDGAYALTKSASLYAENDFNDNFKLVESKVGVKVNF